MSDIVIFSFPSNFKIRSLADAKKFLELVAKSTGEIRWEDERRDWYASKTNTVSSGCPLGKPVVCWRWKRERGDIFAPYLAVEDPIREVYAQRKHINRRYFTREV